MKNLGLFLLCALLFQSCLFDGPTERVDPYYTALSWGKHRPRIPLLKPLAIYKDRMTPHQWGLTYDDLIINDHGFSFDHTVGTDSIIDIGVDSPYIYGKIFEKEYQSEIYSIGDYAYARKYGGMAYSKKIRKIDSNRILIQPIDSINKIFLLPERWFVINVADSTTKAFFSERKYHKYLKEKGIPEKMYNIDSLNKVYGKTGILPWFPDSIQVKIKNRKR